MLWCLDFILSLVGSLWDSVVEVAYSGNVEDGNS